jgi:hypothetical protein
MAEPASPLLVTGLVAVAASALGPLLGPHALIVIVSAGGAFLAAAEAHTESRREVFIYVVRGALFALCFAAISAEWVERHWGLPGHSLLAGVALGIGYQAHQAHRLVRVGWQRIFPRRPDNGDAK